MAETYYSIDDANALLPRVRPLLERIRDQQAVLAKDKSLAVVRQKAAQNGGGTPARHLSQLAQTMEKDLRQLQAWGVVLRDPTTGLIDFFHKREGETVFLCWRLGEGKIEWWHPVNTGIAGREHL